MSQSLSGVPTASIFALIRCSMSERMTPTFRLVKLADRTLLTNKNAPFFYTIFGHRSGKRLVLLILSF
jgi:hypothetical protein